MKLKNKYSKQYIYIYITIKSLRTKFDIISKEYDISKLL